MTADALSGGVSRRLRYVLPLLLVVLLAVASASPARAADATPACPDTTAPPDVPGAMAQLLAFVEQYRTTNTVPSQAEVEAKLAELFRLVDYLLEQSGQMSEGEVELLLSQAEEMLAKEGVPAEHITAAKDTLRNLLNAEQPPTAEQALAALLEAVKPYLLTQGVTEAMMTAIHAYLVQFLPAADDCPTPEAPAPTPTAAPAVPVDSSGGAETTTSPTNPLATTGIDPILLLGVVAIAMIAGGLALEAGQRRPRRSSYRR